MAALRELLAVFTTKVEETGFKKASEKIEGIKGQIEKLVGALAGAFIGNEFKEFILGQIEAGDALVDLADKLGVGTQELQQFQYGAGIFGVAAEDAGRALGFLNKNVGEAVGGNQEAAKTFAELGVTLKDANGEVRETADLIPEIADAFAQMPSQQERTAKAMAIFGKQGAALLPFLKDGKEGIEALNKEFKDLGGGLSKEFLDQADKAGDMLFRLDFATKGLKSQIALTLIPTVLDITKKLIEWVAGLRKLVEGTNIIKTMTIAAVALGVALLPITGEFLLIAAAVAAAYLIFDDLYTLFTGGDSIIGDYIDKMGQVGDAKKLVEEVKAAVEGLNKAWQDTGITMGDVGKVGKFVLDFLVGGVTQLVEWFGLLVRDIGRVINFFTKAGFTGRIAEIGEALTDKGEKIDPATGKRDYSPSGFIQNSAADLRATSDRLYAERAAAIGIENAKGFTGKETIGGVGSTAAFGPPVPPGWGQSGAQTVEQNNQVQVTVQGGASPQETGRNVATGVKDAMTNQLKDALGAIAANGGA